ncbi:MAG: DUF370 domain-containing protein [Chloroflexi bacterium]|jgi:regulator of extracellular matrix RemA (YlzA/DUF370 family)|nr:DUF370 domain-containing protein [Chloroflexota bacterium]
MSADLVHIGFENIIAMSRVIAMLSPTQQPTKRLIQEARNKGMLIDATHARKAKAAVVMDTGHIVLAAISAETIARRLDASRGEASFKSGSDEEEK